MTTQKQKSVILAERQKLYETNRKLFVEYDRLKNRYFKLCKESTDSQHKIYSNAMDIQDLANQLEFGYIDEKTANKQINKLNKEIAELDKKIETLELRAKTCKKNFNIINDKMNKITNKIEILTTRIGKLGIKE